MNKQISEFIGAFIGDGCLNLYNRKDRPSNVETLNFTGSWINDSQYYKEIINNIIKTNFKANLRMYRRKEDNTIRVIISNKKVINFLKSLGYTFGPKTNSVYIPNKIIKNKELSLACLRGIFNTDGCIYRRYSKKYNRHKKIYSNYKVIQFKSNSNRLIKQIKFILYRENISTNKITQDNRAYVLRITTQGEVNRFVSILKFNHKHHINRLNTIK